MNNKRSAYQLLLVLLVVLSACNTNSEKASKAEDTIPEEAKLGSSEVYTLNGDTIPSIKWTAYKFTDKAGVSGTFNNVKYNTASKKGTVKQLLEHSSFTIETKSVNSSLELRDERIFTYFFSEIGAEVITGEFTEVDEKGGKVKIIIGENSHTVPFTYTVSPDKITVTTSLDLLLWKASSGINALNEVCKDVHTGTDGVSKLWPDVDVVTEIFITP